VIVEYVSYRIDDGRREAFEVRSFSRL